MDRTEEIIRLVWEVEKKLDTVVALGVGTRCDEQGEDHVVAPILERLGYKLERAKTNIGLGRITNADWNLPYVEETGTRMTNTLHRYGPSGKLPRRLHYFRHRAARARTTKIRLPKLRKFLQIATEFKPVNLGDARHGGALRPSRHMDPTSHWHRDITPDFDAVIAGLDHPTTCAAVFDNKRCGRGLRQAHQGRGPGAQHQYLDLDRRRRAVLPLRGQFRGTASGYSLGFEGKTNKLPNSQSA